MKQTLLITGGAGYIGSHTAFLAQQLGHRVIIVDNLSQEQTFNHPWATFIKADLADTDALTSIFKTHSIDAVLHFAASIEVGRSVKEPLLFYKNNVTNTITLLQTMLTHNVKTFIFSSSCAVYGIPQYLPLDEEHPKNPISPYGMTKLMVEQILNDLQTSDNLRFVALRYFNAAGALPEHGLCEHHIPETHAIPLVINAALTGQPFHIFGTDYSTPDGTCIRDYLHVIDLAHAHLKAITYLNTGAPSTHLNLGTGQGHSVRELINAVQQITNTTITVIESPRRAGDPAQLVANPTKAITTLNWKPHYISLQAICSGLTRALPSPGASPLHPGRATRPAPRQD